MTKGKKKTIADRIFDLQERISNDRAMIKVLRTKMLKEDSDPKSMKRIQTLILKIIELREKTKMQKNLREICLEFSDNILRYGDVSIAKKYKDKVLIISFDYITKDVFNFFVTVKEFDKRNDSKLSAISNSSEKTELIRLQITAGYEHNPTWIVCRQGEYMGFVSLILDDLVTEMIESSRDFEMEKNKKEQLNFSQIDF